MSHDAHQPSLFAAPRRSSWHWLRSRVWVCSLILFVLFTAIGIASIWFVLNWQGENAAPQRRAQMTGGGIVYCWDTPSTWSYFGRPNMNLGTNLSVNGQRVTYHFDWYSGPLDVSLGIHPIRLTAGNVQVSLFALALVAAIPAAVHLIRRRFRVEHWQCRTCRYDLRNTPPDHPCPECGTARTTPSTK